MNSIFRRIMSQDITIRLLNNAEIAEKKLIELRTKLEVIKRLKIEEKIQQLTHENGVLASKVEKAKADLIRLETRNGKIQYAVNSKQCAASAKTEEPARPELEPQTVTKKEKKEKSLSAKKNTEKPTENANDSVDVRKLDLRIGKIIDINKHPDADSLYVEQIDCGEQKPRTVVSGLVNHVPIDQMRDRIVMVLCNLKPVKMRGVTSEAMVMCASSTEKVEVLLPPEGSAPGDLVTCEGYPREPEPQLNPKKKIFETCAPDLKTNANKVACYKDSPLVVAGKGPVVAPTLTNVNVK